MTIKEAADKYNVSKQAIRKRINTMPTTAYTVDSTGVYQINDEGVKLLDKIYSTRSVNVDSKVDTTTLSELVARLTAEVDSKNKEIDRLLTLLDQEQKLHAIDAQKLQALERKKEETHKKKWFLFKRKEESSD